MVSYEKLDPTTYEKFKFPLLISLDKTAEALDFVSATIHADFKNTLLNVFCPHNKELCLTFDYEINGKLHHTTFVAKIPNINQK